MYQDRYDLIIDFETLDVNTRSCAVIDCAVLPFNWGLFCSKTPYTPETLMSQVKRYKLDVEDQVRNYNYTVDKDTVKWWQSLDKEITNKILPSNEDLTVKEFCHSFMSDIRSMPKINYWWSRNNTFDPVILWRLLFTEYNRYETDQYIPHWAIRDIRTWIDAKFDFETKTNFPIGNWFQKHNSTHDVVADVLRLQIIARSEEGLDFAVI